MAMLTRLHGKPDVLCRMQPKKAVFSRRPFKIGECCLVPASIRVKSVHEEKSTASVFNIGGDVPNGFRFTINPMSLDVPCPVWFMSSTNQKKYSNMKIVMVNMNVSVDQVKAEGKGSSAAKGKSAELSSVSIPMLVNSSPLKVGEELVYHDPHVAPKGIKRTHELI